MSRDRHSRDAGWISPIGMLQRNAAQAGAYLIDLFLVGVRLMIVVPLERAHTLSHTHAQAPCLPVVCPWVGS